MVKFIRSSPNRRDRFLSLQKGGTKLNLVLSVPTRWNSTWLMLVRFKKLKLTVIKYLHEYGEEQKLRFLTRVEWRHIDYLIELLRPFYTFTVVISRMKQSPTIQFVIPTFDTLLAHLQKYINVLQNKTTPWKLQLRDALQESSAKLMGYWRKMINGMSDLYGIALLLDPQAKEDAFAEMQTSILDGRNVRVYYFACCNNYPLTLIGTGIYQDSQYQTRLPGF